MTHEQTHRHGGGIIGTTEDGLIPITITPITRRSTTITDGIITGPTTTGATLTIDITTITDGGRAEV